MKILILNWKSPTDSSAGGAERYVLEVATRWAADGHEVTIFGPRSTGNPATILSRRPNLQYVGAGSRLTVFRAADRYLQRSGSQFDWVLESVSTRPFAAHQIVGDRAVALYHQTAEEVWHLEFPMPLALVGRQVLEPIWIRRMRKARVVANSPSTAAALARFGVASYATVPPGCDFSSASRVRSCPNQPPRLLWIGRLVRTKRPGDAILACDLIRRAVPEASLDLVGGGYLEAELRSQAGEGVTIHGYLDEVAKGRLLAQSDLLLLPGTREGWGIVAMEAAAYGIPVVAYDVPGLRDAVIDGVTGVVAPCTPEALAVGAVRILEDVQLWRRLSLGGMAWARSHTWDETARSLLSVLCATGSPVGTVGTGYPGTQTELDSRGDRILSVRPTC